MSDDARPKFDWGRRVRAAVDLFNDGSFPDSEPESLLVKAGDLGEGLRERRRRPIDLHPTPARVPG